MKTLVLNCKFDRLEYSIVDDCSPRKTDDGFATLNRTDSYAQAIADALRELSERFHSIVAARQMRTVAIHCKFGGELFAGPAIFNDDIADKLASLIPLSPLHLPRVLSLARSCRDVFFDMPTVLTFDTSFFVNLPQREYEYGVGKSITGDEDLRRWGYQGLYHQAACQKVVREFRKSGLTGAPRIISIFLGDRPELAAAVGNRPIMVTSGATPLEGLIGKTSCGGIDPSLVLIIADRLKIGPEEINDMLTRRSGILGLTGHSVTLPQLLASDNTTDANAAEIIKYQMLLSCGMAAAATGGVDVVVFCGPYAGQCRRLEQYLMRRIRHCAGGDDRQIISLKMEEGLELLVAQQAGICITHDDAVTV